jgi:PEP-CTERM motif
VSFGLSANAITLPDYYSNYPYSTNLTVEAFANISNSIDHLSISFTATNCIFIGCLTDRGFNSIGSITVTDTSRILDISFVPTTQPEYGSFSLYLAASPGVTGLIPYVASVPEPSTWVLLLLGFAGVGFMSCRRTTGAVKLNERELGCAS